jgi:chromosome segregation ATPase
MTEPTSIEAASARLTKALDMLDAAIERRLEIEKSRAILTQQLHAVDADRARLAAALDTQTARARKLEADHREIARRIDAAMENIRFVLEGREP